MNEQELRVALRNLDIICRGVALKRDEHAQLVNDLKLIEGLIDAHFPKDKPEDKCTA